MPRRGQGVKNTEADFWPLVTITTETDCWLFTGSLDNDGYGKFRVAPEGLAHRIAYRSKVGPIPPRVHVLHSCDKPACCNPAHLSLGNASANMQDMWDKNRHPRPIGERNNHAKLTPEQVLEIRRLCAEGVQQLTLARQFSVTPTTISGIFRRKTWAHL